MNNVTCIFNAIEQGDAKAADELLPLIYEELCLLATQKMAQEKPGQTLQATALVHEAYIRLVSFQKSIFKCVPRGALISLWLARSDGWIYCLGTCSRR